jgi:hypothetical protein
MMSKKDKPTKIEIAPGCFDGTQEELDRLIAEIQRMVDSGELEEIEKDIDQAMEKLQ